MKISLKKIIQIGIASIAVLILLAVVGWHFYFNSLFSVYHDDKYHFSIKYPKTWKVVVHPSANVAVVFLRPKDNALDTLQENFNVTVQPLPKDIFTLEDFSNRIKGQMIAVFGTNTDFVEYKPLQWDWRKGYIMSIEAPKPDDIKLVNAWLLRGDEAYIMTFLGIIHKYVKDGLFVNEMIHSLQLQ